MQFIDTHIHLQDYKSKSAPQIIAEARACGVEKLVCAAVVEADWPVIISLAEQYPRVVIPAFGLHPWYIREAVPGWEKRLEDLLARYPQALVGETGLDRLKDKNIETQGAAFSVHIALATRFKRPLLIHAVKVMEWFENYWKHLPSGFVFHSFTGPKELVAKVLDAGGYLSFSQSLLKLAEPQKIASSIPLNRLLLETDGPYQGLTKEESAPRFIPELARKIADFRGEKIEVFAKAVYQNSLGFINGK